MAKMDIPGVYLHMESYEEVIMIIKARLEELLVNI